MTEQELKAKHSQLLTLSKQREPLEAFTNKDEGSYLVLDKAATVGNKQQNRIQLSPESYRVLQSVALALIKEDLKIIQDQIDETLTIK